MKFRKSERLCSRKSIGKLFAGGNSLFNYPFRVVWLDAGREQPFPVRLAVSVPRKRIRKAVDRNRIKRLIRETYRLNKDYLYQNLQRQNRSIELMVIYVAGQEYDFRYINNKMKELLKTLSDDQNNQDLV